MKKRFFFNALISIELPSEEEVLEAIESDKRYYASHFGRDYNEVTQQEFLNAANIGIRTYREYYLYTQKKILISHFLDEFMEKEIGKINSFVISDEEIQSLINEKKTVLRTAEKFEISFIYFSYFDSKGNELENEALQKKVKRAAECLERLNKGENFNSLVRLYSDDKKTIQATPAGYFGILEKNDALMRSRFSDEILKAFSDSPIGLNPKIYGTDNGLYIFYIHSKSEAKELSAKEQEFFVRSEILEEKKQKFQQEIKMNAVEKYKEIFNVKVY